MPCEVETQTWRSRVDEDRAAAALGLLLLAGLRARDRGQARCRGRPAASWTGECRRPRRRAGVPWSPSQPTISWSGETPRPKCSTSRERTSPVPDTCCSSGPASVPAMPIAPSPIGAQTPQVSRGSSREVPSGRRSRQLPSPKPGSDAKAYAIRGSVADGQAGDRERRRRPGRAVRARRARRGGAGVPRRTTRAGRGEQRQSQHGGGAASGSRSGVMVLGPRRSVESCRNPGSRLGDPATS